MDALNKVLYDQFDLNIENRCLYTNLKCWVFLVWVNKEHSASGFLLTLRVLTNWGTSKLRVSETPKRPKDSP